MVSSRWHLPVRRRIRVAAVLAGVAAALATTGFMALAAPGRPNFTGPPNVTITFPADGGDYNAAGWAAGCSPAGICGMTSANDATVASVTVAIYEASTGRYWNGSSFTERFPQYNLATGTSTWNYPFSPSANTIYTVYAQATNRFGTSRPEVVSFRYDTVPPREPVVISHPPSTTTSTSASFEFLDSSGPHLTFYCYLDAGTAAPCTGRTDDEDAPVVVGHQDYSGLATGPHCFYVYATDEAGNQSPTADYCWTITLLTSTNFSVGGNLTSPLYPGTSEPLDLTFTNPNSSAITIASGGITSSNITITSNKVGCTASNFEVSQGLTSAVTIPANQASPISLQSLSVPPPDWPVIEMVDTDTDQDACEGATLTLTYSGIEATG
jgi:hypothetical protein